ALSNLYWIVSAVFAPVNTGLRYTASRVGLSGPMQILQQNLLIWFYTAFVHRVGTYLIEVYSGRLRVGAARYRQLLEQHERVKAGVPGEPPRDGQQPPPPVTDAVDEVRRVTVTLMGQVKVGKSSLINALLGERRAMTDVLPATHEIARYELQPEGIPT